jgi:hypothetical protein
MNIQDYICECAPSLKTRNLLITNIVVTIISFLIFYYFDTPIELIGATGIAWVLISSIETIRKLRKQTIPFSQG